MITCLDSIFESSFQKKKKTILYSYKQNLIYRNILINDRHVHVYLNSYKLGQT